MLAEVAPNCTVHGWNVEEFDADGACLMTIFLGPDAELRARDYAASRMGEPKEGRDYFRQHRDVLNHNAPKPKDRMITHRDHGGTSDDKGTVGEAIDAMFGQRRNDGRPNQYDPFLSGTK